MTTIIATALEGGSSLEAALGVGDSLEQDLAGAAPALVMVFASTKQCLAEITGSLATRFPSAAVLGASTAGEFTEKGDHKGTVSALAVAGDFRVFAGLGEGLAESPKNAVKAAIEAFPETVEGLPHRTALLLVDPLSGRSEEAALFTAGLLGGDIRLAGGAAGDDLAMKQTQVAHAGEVKSDAVVVGLIFSKKPLGVGVHHGHEPISKPLMVTRAEGSTVFEIEGRPAWDVWAEMTRERAALLGFDPNTLNDNEVGAFLLRYEAGLASGETFKIRAPLSRGDDGSLSFACEVPEGSVIRITEGESDKQIQSARLAARKAKAQLGGATSGALVFDCICRNLILGERFADAITEMNEELGGAPLAGFETYGEIALDAGDFSGFHNTTTVVLAFPR